MDNFGYLEETDLDTFNQIEESLENGSMIYFAVENGNVLATCMVKPLDDAGTWELCKLGSNKHLSHKAAVHIYEKYGFHEIKLDDYEYDRGDIAFEYMVP